MKRGSSSQEVKRLNRNRVFRYINSKEMTSIQDTANALKMSVPTALQMVNELKSLGLAEEIGEFQSTGGRKAKAIATVKSACYAIGLDITRNHIGIVLTDLSQKVLHHMRIRKAYKNESSYYTEVMEILADFLKEHHLPEKKIIGMGIAVPAIVDSNNNFISFSHALNIRNLTMDKYLLNSPYPYVILNDANAAAMTEYINSDISSTMVYLSLSNTVGGAIVVEAGAQGESTANLWLGNNWQSGEFGHMVIHPGGKRCYCGKRGCLDAYCSAHCLSKHTNGSLEQFLHEMKQGNHNFQTIWTTYLDNLSIAVDNIRMSFDSDVILGGYVGSYMGPYIQKLRDKVAEKNIFGYTGDYVKECKFLVEASALGAAMYQIEKQVSTF